MGADRRSTYTVAAVKAEHRGKRQDVFMKQEPMEAEEVSTHDSQFSSVATLADGRHFYSEQAQADDTISSPGSSPTASAATRYSPGEGFMPPAMAVLWRFSRSTAHRDPQCWSSEISTGVAVPTATVQPGSKKVHATSNRGGDPREAGGASITRAVGGVRGISKPVALADVDEGEEGCRAQHRELMQASGGQKVEGLEGLNVQSPGGGVVERLRTIVPKEPRSKMAPTLPARLRMTEFVQRCADAGDGGDNGSKADCDVSNGVRLRAHVDTSGSDLPLRPDAKVRRGLISGRRACLV